MNSIVDDIIEQFPEIIQIQTINRGDYLISAGSIEKFIYKVDSGAFKISYQTAFKEHIIRFAYKNSVFSTVDRFIKQMQSFDNYLQMALKTNMHQFKNSGNYFSIYPIEFGRYFQI
jgi:CRP-like cAMP-binding protein